MNVCDSLGARNELHIFMTVPLHHVVGKLGADRRLKAVAIARLDGVPAR